MSAQSDGRPAAESTFLPLRRESLVAAMLDRALLAHRNGTLDELMRQHPLAARWLMRRFVPIVRGAAGDALDGTPAQAAVAHLLLRWAVSQLRPDSEARLDGISEDTWLHGVAWRPMLSVMCHYGLAQVPRFPGHYRPRADEVAVDSLCGLWDVAASTVYRSVERGRSLMARTVLTASADVASRLSLRRMVAGQVLARLAIVDPAAQVDWHGRQAVRALARRDAVAALWHWLQAGDMVALIRVLRDQASSLAGDSETDAIVERALARPLSVRLQAELWLACAALARTRNDMDREQSAIETALKIAQAAGDSLMLGVAHGVQGVFHESRDADRAFACFELSIQCLDNADLAGADAAVDRHRLAALVRLAWMYALRQHPNTKPTLDRAQSIARRHVVNDADLGLLEQAWGEYWRLSGDLQRAIAHRQRALLIFERLGDRRSVLATSANLILAYGEAGDFRQAGSYAKRFFELAAQGDVEAALLANAHGNLGVVHWYQGQLDEAILQYREALHSSLAADLRMHANRARYNLAEAHYKRFATSRDADDERLGDEHVSALLAAPAAESTPVLLEAARRLKAEVFAQQPQEFKDRLLPEETAAHFEEMADIGQQRSLLAAPGSPEAHVRAHLAIANAYLAISTKERETALALAERHGLQARFADTLDQLRATFTRSLTREQQLVGAWKLPAADLLDDGRRFALAALLLAEGAVNKSRYAEVCGVAPATASKHLALLTERGLLVQTGKGPSTRYRLPSPAASAAP